MAMVTAASARVKPRSRGERTKESVSLEVSVVGGFAP